MEQGAEVYLMAISNERVGDIIIFILGMLWLGIYIIYNDCQSSRLYRKRNAILVTLAVSLAVIGSILVAVYLH